MDTHISQAAVNAFWQLVAINKKSGDPELQAWLESEVAQPVLIELLANVPCSQTVH